MDYSEINCCRVCSGTDLVPLFSLGEQHLSDFVPPGQEHAVPKAPLDLVLCNGCTLVQLRHTVNQERLYRHYHYRSGTTQTMRDALRDVTREAEQRVDLQWGDVVLDIGANDGTLLRSYSSRRHLVTVGFEPAANLAEAGEKEIDLFVCGFWDANRYVGLVNKQAKVVTACGMLYDLPDPHAFLRDVARVLHPDGLFIAQLMMLRDMLAMGDVGNICSEHLEYYSLRSFQRLLDAHGLEIDHYETNKVNGQSTRFYIRHRKGKGWVHVGFANEAIREQEQGYADPAFYREWFADLQKDRDKIHNFVLAERLKGKRAWVLGASTKGAVMAQWWGLDSRLIDGASERSREKWGLVTSGTGIKIYSEEEAREAKPDLFIVMPYAFAEEIIARERPWLDAGGVFLVPLPVPRLVYVDGGELKERML